MRELLFRAFKVVVSVVIPLASVATGLRAVTVDPFWLLKRRSLLLRSLLAILILVPLGTVVFLQAVHASPLVKTGLIVSILAVGIGPPAAFKRARAAEANVAHAEANVAYEVELNVVLLILAIAFIPAALALLGVYFRLPLRLDPTRVLGLVFTRALIPLTIGVLVARLLPRVAAPLARVAGPVVQISLLAVVVVALAATWRGLITLGPQAWALCAAVALGAMVVGHLCGGPDPQQRRVLASFASMRFPGLALLIAAVTPFSKQVVPVVLAYAISTLVLVALYDLIASRRGRTSGRTMPVTTAPSPA
jgi:BASS family bile acid:Na+ symporter